MLKLGLADHIVGVGAVCFAGLQAVLGNEGAQAVGELSLRHPKSLSRCILRWPSKAHADVDAHQRVVPTCETKFRPFLSQLRQISRGKALQSLPAAHGKYFSHTHKLGAYDPLSVQNSAVLQWCACESWSTFPLQLCGKADYLIAVWRLSNRVSITVYPVANRALGKQSARLGPQNRPCGAAIQSGWHHKVAAHPVEVALEQLCLCSRQAQRGVIDCQSSRHCCWRVECKEQDIGGPVNGPAENHVDPHFMAARSEVMESEGKRKREMLEAEPYEVAFKPSVTKW